MEDFRKNNNILNEKGKMIGKIALQSPEELDRLNKLAKRIEDLNEEMREEETVLRFLRARDGDIIKAEQMIRKSAIWREENAVMSYRNYELSLVLKDDYIIEHFGFDLFGHPVIYVPLGRWNIRDRLNDGYLQETLEARLYLLEGIIMTAIDNSTRAEFSVIIDLSELSFYKVAHMETMNVVTKLMQEFDQNYPERLKCAFVVNTPWVFPYAFSLIKPWIAAKTLDKVHVFDGNKTKWMQALEKHISFEVLSQHLSV